VSVTLDASVWLAAAIPGEPDHEAARQVVDRLVRDGEPLDQPTLFVVEVAGAVRRRSGSAQQAADAVARIASLRSIRLHALAGPLAESAAGIAGVVGLRGADAVYLSTSVAAGATLVTLDHELRDRGRAVASVLSPSEWLASTSRS
jgi:predicted nucleic acid-binding protein